MRAIAAKNLFCALVVLLGLWTALPQADARVHRQRRHHVVIKKPVKKDLVETTAASGQFSMLTRAIREAGLTSKLKTQKNLTLFAPTDRAFAELPRGTMEELFLPENKDKLVRMLTYHVLPQTALQAGKTVKTLNGDTVDISAMGKQLRVNDVAVSQAGIPTANGIIHPVTRVLMPEQ